MGWLNLEWGFVGLRVVTARLLLLPFVNDRWIDTTTGLDFQPKVAEPGLRGKERKKDSRSWIDSNMYPRVKVTKQQEPVVVKEETTAFILKVIESLSLENNHPPRILTSKQGNGTEAEIYSPPSCARISKSNHKNFLTPPLPTSKVRKDKELADNNRANIRASSVPRPRAVLSSPDNDEMIGNQNQKLRDSRQHEKRQMISQNLHAPTRLIHRNLRAESPVNLKKASKEAGSNSHLKQKQASQPAASRPRPLVRN
ncbi:hypothetical protein J5N97_023455 [Dioscorea zingiberensis]|uniref:Uncharacterized protein n=1 Tax=Dioscorea zingiberensis TaxID=325984 RepID=A0A9D5C5A5_9LILI|nr:hypothetical protein J5N97_023455 [Dioscorea zingiberensis]